VSGWVVAPRIEWNGQTAFGDRADAAEAEVVNPLLILGIDKGIQGLVGHARPEGTEGIRRFLAEGVVGGRHGVPSRTIVIPEARSASRLTAFSWSWGLAPRTDPLDALPLVVHDLWPAPDPEEEGAEITVPITVWCRPIGAEVPQTTQQHGVGNDWRVAGTSFLADDPVIYGAEEVENSSAAGSHSFTVVNGGSFATRSGRAWQLELTASGSVTNPWIEIGDRRVVFTATLTSGQVLTVDADRQTWIGSQRISALPTTPDADAPDWGILEPGEEGNAVTLGASSGSFAVAFKSRPTWL
jgi:hypothetical protein